MAAKVFEPASSQDLLWVAGRSSLTSSTRDSWLGKMSDTLTCIHFGYIPEEYLPHPHPRERIKGLTLEETGQIANGR